MRPAVQPPRSADPKLPLALPAACMPPLVALQPGSPAPGLLAPAFFSRQRSPSTARGCPPPPPPARRSEMPPEGKVGVSPVCILGVNINRGQEISLRLRTDDLRG